MIYLLTLRCITNNGDGNLILKLILLKVPLGISGYIVTVSFKAYLDNDVIEKVVTSATLNVGDPETDTCDTEIFPSDRLKGSKVLSFMVEIVVDKPLKWN